MSGFINRAAWEVSSTQRIDKWLWFARVVKTRSLAAKLVEAGHVRVNGLRSDSAARALRIGDVLTVALERQVRVLRVLADGDRRGPFKDASLLFEDLSASCDGPASRALGKASGPALALQPRSDYAAASQEGRGRRS